MEPSIKKIVVIGPESTGKSTLCSQLAEHFQTQWAPEFAREYLLKHGTNYSFEDLLTIAKGQIATEEKYLSSIVSRQPSDSSRFTSHDSRLIFLDTDMYVMKVWCEFVFGKCHHYIIDEITTRQYDLYLLCNIDLPWTKDELREYPDLATREKLFYIYKDILVNQSTPWEIISGAHDERLEHAITAVNKHISHFPL